MAGGLFNRVKGHVGQQVDQGFSFLDDYALEPLFSERSPKLLALVVVFGKTLFDFLYKGTQVRKPVSEFIDLAKDDCGVLAVVQLVAPGDFLVRDEF